MKVHELKTLPEYFEAVFMGKKNFEIRENDRDFKVGDFVTLMEYDAKTGYTGKKLSRRITYIFKGGNYGLHENFVILSI